MGLVKRRVNSFVVERTIRQTQRYVDVLRFSELFEFDEIEETILKMFVTRETFSYGEILAAVKYLYSEATNKETKTAIESLLAKQVLQCQHNWRADWVSSLPTKVDGTKKAMHSHLRFCIDLKLIRRYSLEMDLAFQVIPQESFQNSQEN